MSVLLIGATGQLGAALAASAGRAVLAPARAELDLADPATIAPYVAGVRPTLIVNAAAHTAVDRAESEPDLALAINATAAGQLATAAHDIGARLVHVSTDFVFDGTASRPYRPDATPAPLSVYGATKLAGEVAVQAAHPSALILRTAWVYGATGSNFVRTMLRLMATKSEVRVIADQIGTPTHAAGLARAIWALAAENTSGIFHWTDAGVASWYDFAVAIQEEALALGLLADAVPVIPIRTEDYPTPATRPAMSVLDKSATWAITGPARHWRVELRLALAEIAGKAG